MIHVLIVFWLLTQVKYIKNNLLLQEPRKMVWVLWNSLDVKCIQKSCRNSHPSSFQTQIYCGFISCHIMLSVQEEKGGVWISSGPGLHFALIVEDKNPNTLNLSFINRFGPYQGYFTRTLFNVCVFYYWKKEVLFFNKLKRQICLQSYIYILNCLTRNICMHWNLCDFCWFLPGEDPETRRMRTVKNIADLRQNLEETMSSLRGTQISHRYAAFV